MDLKINEPYYKGSDHFLIIREDKYSYYILDSIALEMLEEFDELEPLFEIEKTFDSEWHLKQFLTEQGVQL